MTVDMEQLKKSALLLKAIFEEAYKAHNENYKIIKQTNKNDDVELDISHNVIGVGAEGMHKVFIETLDNYDWNLNKFFESAANIQHHLFYGKDWAEVYPNEGLGKNKEHLGRFTPKELIEKRANEAKQNIERLAAELGLNH